MDKKDKDDKDKKAPEQPVADSKPASKKPLPSDALSRSTEDLKADGVVLDDKSLPSEIEQKKLSAIRRFFRVVNIYLLVFVLLVVVGIAIMVVSWINAQNSNKPISIADGSLTQDQLKSLANSDATIGGSAQTLTIQGNAVINGETLIRRNLAIAGDIQVGGTFKIQNMSVAGLSNLGSAQINSLQVASTTVLQGTTTIDALNVAGAANFSGSVQIGNLVVSKITLSGNGVLEVPNHITFTGAAPSRSINTAALGNGGSVSLNGSDSAGSINISTGNNTAPGCFVTINFNQRFANTPHVVVTPVGAAAGGLQYYITRTNANFQVCVANTAPTYSTFGFDYFVTG